MRTLTKIIAAATFICGFAAPHQWLGTLICIALLWADAEQKKKEKSTQK